MPSLSRHLPRDLTDVRRIYGALQAVADASGHIVGRKILLLFTTGFGELSATTGLTSPDRRRYSPLEQSLNHNNVAVYPVDLAPVDVANSQRTFLTYLATDSGGTYTQRVSNFGALLRKIADENTSYYLLSY
jgi:hypothetical protein